MLLSSLQRLAAACGPSGLGRGGIAVAASCGSSSSSSSLWQQLRAFSDEAGSGDKPGEEPAAAAASAAADDVAGGSEGGDDALVAAEAAEGDEEVEEVDEDVPFGLIGGPRQESGNHGRSWHSSAPGNHRALRPVPPAPSQCPPALPPADFDSAAGTGGGVVPPELFSKRQRAWLGVGDPDKYQHFLPALSRKEKGSFADEYVEEEFDVEVRQAAVLGRAVPGRAGPGWAGSFVVSGTWEAAGAPGMPAQQGCSGGRQVATEG